MTYARRWRVAACMAVLWSTAAFAQTGDAGARPIRQDRIWGRSVVGVGIGTDVGVLATLGGGLELARRIRVGPEASWFSLLSMDAKESMRFVALTFAVAADSLSRRHWRFGVGNLHRERDFVPGVSTSDGLALSFGAGLARPRRPIAFTVSFDVVAQVAVTDSGDQKAAMVLLQIGPLFRQ